MLRPRLPWAVLAVVVVAAVAGCAWAAATADDPARVVQVSVLGLLGAGIAAVLVYAAATPLPGPGAGGRTSGSAWFAGGPVDAGCAGGDGGGSGGDCG